MPAIESAGNMQIIHTRCRPESGQWVGRKPGWFIGKAVKVSFDSSPDAGAEFELMWVAIDSVVNGQLEGWLANVPVTLDRIAYGDRVRVRIEEVRAVEVSRKGFRPKRR